MSNKQSRSKRLIKLASGTVLMSAVASFGGQVSQANAGTYSVMGSGAEVREALNTINSLAKPAELACGAKDTKTSNDTKMTEAKCGEGKCGGDTDKKEEKAKDAKAVKDSKEKKIESKTSEAKCGEGKCGDMGKTKMKETNKATDKAKTTDHKTSEAKCGN